MEFARRAAAAARVDGDHHLPDPSPHAQVTVEALRRELLKERIREEIIAAELAERRDLEPEVRRELRLEHAVPHHGTSPVRQRDRLHLHMPLSPEICLEEAAIGTPGGVLMSRRSVKDRIGEWYRPPWHDRSADEEDASSGRARLPNKTFSGVKRKRTAETSAANNEKSFDKWSCALCHVKLYCELSFKEHCAGHLHRSNVADMELTKQTTGLKRIVTAESYAHLQHNPTSWNCSICQVKCSGELDLRFHLEGRRHQENVEALYTENKEIEGNSGLQEAKLYEKKEPQLADKNRRSVSRWNCSICRANCSSESDLESHLQGRRHQQNLKAQFLEGNSTAVVWHLGGKKHLTVLSAYN